MTQRIFDAADWSQKEDTFTHIFYEQNTRQFWLPEEISLSGDLLSWKLMSVEEKSVYKKAIAGLTLLDTEQGNTGMHSIMTRVSGHQRKAVLSFMGMMENIHAKSYSNIFLTLASAEEIREIFEWIRGNKFLQRKAQIITSVYESSEEGEIALFQREVASVLLESFLFYSGFYFPLLCYGQGRLMQSGEIINLIIRDESVHGVYVGLLAQEIFNKQTDEVKEELEAWTHRLLSQLYENELSYTEDIYDEVGLAHDVKKFIRYNANKALQNLGFEPYFKTEDVNPVVINGLNTKAKTHDFFSMKGNSYKMAVVEPLKDDDFYFESTNI